MPVRSEQEFKLGLIGGEGEQHCQGIARSLSNPDIIYLSHDTGQVWRSIDGGNIWKKTLNKNLSAIAGQSIEVDPINPDSVFVIMWHSWDTFNPQTDGLYHSIDGGNTWKHVAKVSTQNSRWYEHNITFDPSSIKNTGASRWYTAFNNDGSTYDEGIYRSDDYGNNWNLASSLDGHSERYYAIQAHPDDGKTLYVASDIGLFISNDRGNTLSPIGNLPPGTVSSLAVSPKDNKLVYAVVYKNGLFKSSDNGRTFKLLKSNPSASHVFINPGYPDVIYFTGGLSGSKDELSSVSTDAGKTWKTISLSPAPGLLRSYKTRMGGNMTGVVPNPLNPCEAVAFSIAALWKTENNTEFSDSSTLFTGYHCGNYNSGIIFNSDNPKNFASFNADVGMAITFNGGDYFYRRGIPKEWRRGKSPKIDWTSMHGAVFRPGTQTIISAAGYVFTKRLVKSVDFGRHWSLYGDFGNPDKLDEINPRQNYWFFCFHPSDNNFVFTENKRSIDAGETWEEISFLTRNNASIIGMFYAKSIDQTEEFVLFAIKRPRTEIFRSFDNGLTWHSYVQTGWPMNGHDSKPIVAFDPSNPDIIYTIDKNRDIARFDGKKWASLGLLKIATYSSGPVNFPRAIAIDPRHSEIIYAGMHLCGSETIWRSTDSGTTWQNISYNIPRLHVGGFSVSPHTGEVFKGGPDGTYVFPPPYEEKLLTYDKCIPLEN